MRVKNNYEVSNLAYKPNPQENKIKKIVLSTFMALTMAFTLANAEKIKFYTDTKGQVFTSDAQGRMLLEERSSLASDIASKLQWSGTHYFGFTHKKLKQEDATNNFEMRRNYLGVKAHLLENPKSYIRVTLDATYTNKTANKDGYASLYVKYAYLYLNEILPYTGVEIGMVHRPWIDYEEHQGWHIRSIATVFAEAQEASGLTNSADLGFNIQTKTPYFTSEAGLFNGEGYHGENDDERAHVGSGLSLEWRTTAALLGNGDEKRGIDKNYFDLSFFGQYNMNNSKNADIAGEEKTYLWYGVHTVYNASSFLIAAQYIKAINEQKGVVKILSPAGTMDWNGQGYSLNGTYFLGAKKEYSIFARYDSWEAKNTVTKEINQQRNSIYGIAWQQNSNLKWLLCGQTYNEQKDDKKNWTSGMLTAEIVW